MPNKPTPELTPERLSPGKRRWRTMGTVFGSCLIVLALVLAFTGYGDPEEFPDGTAQMTWSGIVLASLLFGGCAMIFLADSPWTLFQIVLMFGGGILGGVAAEGMGDQNARIGGVGAGLGFAVGAAVAFVATWGLSRLYDVFHRFRTRHNHDHGSV